MFYNDISSCGPGATGLQTECPGWGEDTRLNYQGMRQHITLHYRHITLTFVREMSRLIISKESRACECIFACCEVSQYIWWWKWWWLVLVWCMNPGSGVRSGLIMSYQHIPNIYKYIQTAGRGTGHRPKYTDTSDTHLKHWVEHEWREQNRKTLDRISGRHSIFHVEIFFCIWPQMYENF